MAQTADSAPKKGSFLTQKAGPLPVWAYGAIALVVGYLYIKHSQSSSSKSGQAPSATLIQTGSGMWHRPGGPVHVKAPVKGPPPPPPPKGPTGPPSQMPQPTVNPNNYPMSLSNGQGLEILGKMIGPNGLYAGDNVSHNAPVYAYTQGSWKQGFNAPSLPVGTPLATLTTFASDVGNYNPHEQLK